MNKEPLCLILPDGLVPELLQGEWNLDIHPQELQVLAFWDTFEWGLWFGGHLLYSSCGTYSLCVREVGWPGKTLCREQAATGRRFWNDFGNMEMRTRLEGMLGARGLAQVAEGVFRLRCCDMRNNSGKIVCRLEWTSLSEAGRSKKELLHCCRVLPLLGYETEAAQVLQRLLLHGARLSGEGPLEMLLRQTGNIPRKYTLRPLFGLEMDMPAREGVGLIMRKMLDIARQNMPGIVAGHDTEFLHDYRICLRKMRSVLNLVKDAYPVGASQRMRTILGELARQTNRLRDLDVCRAAWHDYTALLPPELRSALDEMCRDLSAQREQEAGQIASRMRSDSTLRLFQEIEEFFAPQTLHEPSPAASLPVGPLAFRGIIRRYRKIRRITAGTGAETAAEEVHRLRIECKKLRYLMEFFAELAPGTEGTDMLKQLRRLQNRLGEFNDALVQQRSLLKQWGEKPSGTGVALAAGGLAAILFQKQQQARVLIDEALAEFSSNRTAMLFKQTFTLADAAQAKTKRGGRQ